MDLEFVVTVVGIGCFVASSLLAIASLFGSRTGGERAAMALLAAGGTALAGVLVSRGMQAGSIFSFNRFEALTCYTLSLSAAYLLLTSYRYTRGIAGILIPYATLILLCGISAVGKNGAVSVPIQGPWLALHVVTAYAAYGVFTLASINAAVYLMQDSSLKHKRFGIIWERLPSLETLDQLMSRLVGLAFLLFSIAIIVGFILVHRSGGGDEWFTDPKVGATVATWILMA
ncbi:MAG: cytochrome c biogenesis protein CcsA, partial [bacterium]